MLSALAANLDLLVILTGALVGIAAALPGTFLVLRGSAMLSDAISHSILLGIFLVWWLTREIGGPVQLAGASLAGIASVGLSELLARTRRVRMDAAIGLVFPAFFALGVLLISLNARDVHLDQHAVLLGEIGFIWLDTVPRLGVELPRALLSIAVLALVNAVFIGLFWKELKLATFDAALAAALGFAPGLLFYALLALTSVTAVAAFDAVGVILFVAFVIVPPSAAVLLSDRLGVILALACGIAIASAVSGFFLADLWDVTIGGTMAAMTGVFFSVALVAGPRHGLVAGAMLRRQARRDADCRSLVAHLRNHEGAPEAAQENTAAALGAHLRWSAARQHRVMLTSLDRGLIRRDGAGLALTPKGRALAGEMLDPLRAGDSADAGGTG